MNVFEILAAVVALAVVLAFAGIILRSRWRSNRLSAASRKRVLSRWKLAMQQADPHRRLMEADAVLDAVFTELGYSGSLGEKLRKAGPYVPSLDEVWKAHKLRNRVAHEIGAYVTDRDIQAALAIMERTVAHYCR